MENTQLTNELSSKILNDFILNATAKGVDIVNSLQSVVFLLDKARACDELQKEVDKLNSNLEQNNK